MKKLVWGVTFYFLFNSLSFADTVYLKSGKKITGEIVEQTDEKIRINFDKVMLTFWHNEIDRIDKNPPEEPSPGDVPQYREKNFYLLAVTKLKEPPAEKNFYIHQILPDIVANGWKEDPRINDLLNDNREAIDLFKKATQQNSDGYIFGDKKEVHLTKSLVHNYFAYINLFRLVLIQASEHLSKGEYQAAQEDYLANIKFLKHLGQQKAGMSLGGIHQLIILNIFEPILIQTLQKNYFDKNFYEKALTELSSVNNDEGSLKDLLTDENDFQLANRESLKDAAREKSAHNWEFLAEYITRCKRESQKLLQYQFKTIDAKSEEMFNPKTDEILGLIDEKEIVKRQREFSKGVAFDVTDDGRLTASKESLEQFISNIAQDIDFYVKMELISTARLMPRIISNHFTVVAKQNNMLVGVAIKLYQLDNPGKLPEKLTDLVPQYLPAVPADPFNHFQPIKYVKKENGYLLYSLGPDRIDQLGEKKLNAEKPADKDGDIVLTILE